jgi:hypothetical protein
VAAGVTCQRQRSERQWRAISSSTTPAARISAVTPFPKKSVTAIPINSLNKFRCSDGWGKAHVVINRSGDMLLNHELEIPWRETKFEQAANFSGVVKGLFLHVELIQPRRAASGHGRHNDAQSPNPAG